MGVGAKFGGPAGGAKPLLCESDGGWARSAAPEQRSRRCAAAGAPWGCAGDCPDCGVFPGAVSGRRLWEREGG